MLVMKVSCTKFIHFIFSYYRKIVVCRQQSVSYKSPNGYI